MDAAAEFGRNLVVSTRFSLGMEMSRLTRDGTAEPVSRDQILRRERGQDNIDFPCSADYEQDWQPYPYFLYKISGLCPLVNVFSIVCTVSLHQEASLSQTRF